LDVVLSHSRRESRRGIGISSILHTKNADEKHTKMDFFEDRPPGRNQKVRKKGAIEKFSPKCSNVAI
jgi:hypothetical protein